MKSARTEKVQLPVSSSVSHEDSGKLRDVAPSLVDELMVLTKARLSALVVLTSVVGYLVAPGSRDGLNGWLLFHTVIGIALVAGAASVFNQVMEIGPDRLMKRTLDRPLPAGRMKPSFALCVGWILCLLGSLQLLLMVGWLPAVLALSTVAIYALIYTPMKQTSSWCTVVGGLAGAIPPVIGWTAAGGSLDRGAAVLFAILFFWQMPHFLAINWLYRKDYEDAGFKMWSNQDVSGLRTARLANFFSMLLMLAAISPIWVGLGNRIYFGCALILTGIVLFLAVKFSRDRNATNARILFYSTLLYLPLLLGALVLTTP